MLELRKYVLPENLTFDDFVAIDDKLETEEEFSEDNLIYSLLNPEQDILKKISDKEIVRVPETIPTSKEAKDAINQYSMELF